LHVAPHGLDGRKRDINERPDIVVGGGGWLQEGRYFKGE
jgi:hypothetical protein